MKTRYLLARLCIILLASVPLVDTSEQVNAAQMANITATLTVCASGADFTSLQAAVDAANPGDTIRICDGVFLENLTINKNLTLQGAGQEKTILDGQYLQTAIAINEIAIVSVSDMTITNGVRVMSGEPADQFNGGGGIWNRGVLTLARCTISSNEAYYNLLNPAGGGIFNSGTLTIDSCLIDANRSPSGGGIFNDISGSLTINSSTLSHNGGPSSGGGIYNRGTLIANSSIITGNNTYERGGGILNEIGTATLTDDMVTGNSANNGGGIYNQSGGTVSLVRTDVLTNSISVDGGGIYNGLASNLTLSGSTISGNHSSEGSSGIGIFNLGTLVAENCTIADNQPSSGFDSNLEAKGGGIHNEGTANVMSTIIRGNSAMHGGGYRAGGGIWNNGILTVTTSTIDSNSGGNGAGIYNQSGGKATVNASIIKGNAPNSGIYNGGQLELVNSTVSNNWGVLAGGVFNAEGTALIRNTTIAENLNSGFEPAIGAVSNYAAGGGTVELLNSLIVNNPATDDCVGAITSLGHNIDSDGTCNLTASGDLPNRDPLLGPLADNGGPTLTYAILTGSPAIDHGDISACPASDQRGISRPQGIACDIGAFELEQVAPPTPTCAGLTQEAETSDAVLRGFSVSNDPAASGGTYIGAANGGFYYNGPSPFYQANYCFNVPSDGTYRIKGKVYGADDLSDSFYVTVDGTPAAGYLWDVFPNTSYASDYVNDRNKADPVAVQLSAGEHNVAVYLREQGTRLDTIGLEVIPTQPAPTCSGLVQEAENGVIAGNWAISADAAASNGAYIAAPEESGDFWNGASSAQQASYCFNVDTTGLYRIRGKVYGGDTLSDSFYVQVDGQPSHGYLWDVFPNTSYASDYVSDRNVVDPVELQLSAGQHIVNVYVREDGTRLDTIELQLLNNNPPPIPVCAGLNQEAEDGALSGNFEIGSDSAASGGQYVVTPSGSGDFWNGPNPNHKAEYCFNVDSAGTYRIDGKVYGADNLSDSFYVQVDGRPVNGYLWDVLQNTTYAADSVNDRNQLLNLVTMPLSSGQHTVTIYARESGTRLDTIQLVENTATAQPRTLPPLAAGIGGTVQLDLTNLSQEVDFSTITVKLLDAETGGSQFSQVVIADRFGNYHFDGMTPGEYIVQIDLPNGLVAETNEVTVTATQDELVNLTFKVNGGSASKNTYLPLINR